MSTDRTKNDEQTRPATAPKGLLPLDELTTPGELVNRCLTEGDPLATREVPALALALLGASIAQTGKITDGLIEFHKEEAEKWKARALSAERGIADIQRLHQLLCDPDYARQLMMMVGRSFGEDPPPPSRHKGEFDDDGGV